MERVRRIALALSCFTLFVGTALTTTTGMWWGNALGLSPIVVAQEHLQGRLTLYPYQPTVLPGVVFACARVQGTVLPPATESGLGLWEEFIRACGQLARSPDELRCIQHRNPVSWRIRSDFVVQRGRWVLACESATFVAVFEEKFW